MVFMFMKGTTKEIEAKLKTYTGDDKEELSKSFKEWKQTCIKKVTESSAKMKEEYKAKKEEKDAAALKTMDSSGDGTIQLNEFLSAMEDSTFADALIGMDIQGDLPDPPECLNKIMEM